MFFPKTNWQRSSPETQGVDSSKLKNALAAIEILCGKDRLNETMVLKDGYVIYQGNNIEARHHIWSCTKSFTSICLGILWDMGKCSPETLAADWLPELAEHYPKVTLEHLATFRGGLHFPEEGNPFRIQPPIFYPGERYHYSMETDVLARVLTQIAGESLADLFEHKIGGIIGMNNYSWKDFGIHGGLTVCGGSGLPGHGIETCASDLARLGLLMTNRGVWDGQRLLSEQYIDYATCPRLSSTIPPHLRYEWYTVIQGAYGLNWWCKGENEHGKPLWADAPAGTFAAQGNLNNICLVIPAWRMVLVRCGQDQVIDNYRYNDFFAALK